LNTILWIYLQDVSWTSDEGEVLGTAILYERHGCYENAIQLYNFLKDEGSRTNVVNKALKRLSIIRKKEKLYDEASELWLMLSQENDLQAFRELSIHFEHRVRDYQRAIEFVEEGLAGSNLTEKQRLDFEKRLKRLKKKMIQLDDD